MRSAALSTGRSASRRLTSARRAHHNHAGGGQGALRSTQPHRAALRHGQAARRGMASLPQDRGEVLDGQVNTSSAAFLENAEKMRSQIAELDAALEVVYKSGGERAVDPDEGPAHLGAARVVRGEAQAVAQVGQRDRDVAEALGDGGRWSDAVHVRSADGLTIGWTDGRMD